MIYLDLFLTFLEIGAVSFGGGYGMISLIREMTLSKAWLSESELLNFIAVSESTPGPIAINMATFIGASQGGIFGSFVATLGVVLPAFVIILIIASLIKNLLKLGCVEGILSGIRPCVVGLILATSFIMMISILFNFSSVGDEFSPDFIGIIIFVLVAFTGCIYKKLRKKAVSPILLIIFSAVLGAVLYSIY